VKIIPCSGPLIWWALFKRNSIRWQLRLSSWILRCRLNRSPSPWIKRCSPSWRSKTIAAWTRCVASTHKADRSWNMRWRGRILMWEEWNNDVVNFFIHAMNSKKKSSCFTQDWRNIKDKFLTWLALCCWIICEFELCCERDRNCSPSKLLCLERGDASNEVASMEWGTL